MGDTGTISGEGFSIEISDTQKKADGLFVHLGRVVSGTVKTGAAVELKVDHARRSRLRANHSVTHLLHQALRSSPLVTIAEIHGDAAGFGVGLIAACDVAIAVSDAHFSFPEVGINLAPALVLAWLPRVVDERVSALRARNPRIHSEIKDLLRAFRSIDEDQALELSVDRLVVGALRRGEPVATFDKS